MEIPPHRCKTGDPLCAPLPRIALTGALLDERRELTGVERANRFRCPETRRADVVHRRLCTCVSGSCWQDPRSLVRWACPPSVLALAWRTRTPLVRHHGRENLDHQHRRGVPGRRYRLSCWVRGRRCVSCLRQGRRCLSCLRRGRHFLSCWGLGHHPPSSGDRPSSPL